MLRLTGWCAGDEVLLRSLLESPRDEDEYYLVGSAALDVLEAHASNEATACLVALYEHGPCTLCRRRAILLLRQVGRLPIWMLAEAGLDASDYLRETAEKIARGEDLADD